VREANGGGGEEEGNFPAGMDTDCWTEEREEGLMGVADTAPSRGERQRAKDGSAKSPYRLNITLARESGLVAESFLPFFKLLLFLVAMRISWTRVG